MPIFLDLALEEGIEGGELGIEGGIDGSELRIEGGIDGCEKSVVQVLVFEIVI